MREKKITDEQLDRLEALLDDPSFDEAMRLDEVQGYLCGALAGPVAIPERDRLVEILGSEAAADSEAGREAAALLRVLAAELEVVLADDEALIFYLYPEDDGDDAPSDYGPWCMAYLRAVDTAPKGWIASIVGKDEDDEDDYEDNEEVMWLDERLFPLMVLTGEAEAAARQRGEEWPEGRDLEDLHQQAQEDLARAVSEIHLFWQAKRGTGTVRRDGGKVGRNDPCPCGSGKKFKQCCGKAD